MLSALKVECSRLLQRNATVAAVTVCFTNVNKMDVQYLFNVNIELNLEANQKFPHVCAIHYVKPMIMACSHFSLQSRLCLPTSAAYVKGYGSL